MFGRIGPWELILILAVALVVFGPKRLPEIGKSLGNAFREFRKHANKMQNDIDRDADGPDSDGGAKN